MVITLELALELQEAGLRWKPTSGDRFAIPLPDMAGEVFTVSEMTIEPHHFPSGTILGFNGTTEWALDAVTLGQTVWLPREDQLRTLLGGAFRALRATEAGFEVEVDLPEPAGRLTRCFAHEDAACAYGQAVLALIQVVAEPVGAGRAHGAES